MPGTITLRGVTAAEASIAALRHYQEGRLSEAEHIYRSILTIDPDHAATYDALGRTLAARGELAEAEACYQQAIVLDPGLAEAHYHLGNLLLGQGKVEDAAAKYRRALALKPNFAVARYALIHVTGFFRDPDVFECLAVGMRPGLHVAASTARAFRIWIPACSTGQEVYSLAIIMAELMADMAAAPKVQLIGTDTNKNAVQRAVAGHYRGRPPTTISKQRLERFFRLSNDGYQVCDSLREMCVFSPHDLAKGNPFADVDVISCRNVLSFFFDPGACQLILQSLHAALKPGGWLVLGRGEVLGVPEALFFPVDRDRMIFTRNEPIQSAER